MQNKILVIDEDISNCQAIKNGLEKDGFIVDTAQDIDEASSFDLPSYSLMIIEVLLNRVSGFDFAKRLKNNDETCNIPFIFCTSLGDEEDIILGVNIGADDYIVKPFSMGEFCARVRSVIRRNTISVELKQKMKAGMFEPNIVMKDLRIDRNRKMAFVSGVDCNLTKIEYELLLYLTTNRNVVHSRKSLIEKVWRKDNTSARAIDTNITRLRKKLGSCSGCIVTRPGYGYCFKEP